ncbi:hypothetical protein [Gimesia chilikensis]|uniref:hypothetical protein n=1 Tax=Gimesia chilikensis TaxID=2605989 RepID=UPI0011A972BB|nr:hypothetical protein [Gimesia chilikensis]
MAYRNSKLRLKGNIWGVAVVSWILGALLILSVMGLNEILFRIGPDLWDILEFVVIFLFLNSLFSALIFMLFSYRMEWLADKITASLSTPDENRSDTED